MPFTRTTQMVYLLFFVVKNYPLFHTIAVLVIASPDASYSASHAEHLHWINFPISDGRGVHVLFRTVIQVYKIPLNCVLGPSCPSDGGKTETGRSFTATLFSVLSRVALERKALTHHVPIFDKKPLSFI